MIWARRLTALLALAALGVAAGSYAVGWALCRRRAPPRPEPPIEIAGIRPETHTLESQDGLRFGLWVYPRAGADCAVVLVHGNGSRRAGLAGLSAMVLEAGCHALPITVRAHGASEGEINDFGYGARLDVERAVAFAKARYPRARTFVLGVSLGAAAALFAAPALGDEVQGYLLESPYASLEIATLNRLEMTLPAPLVEPAYALLTMWSHLDVPVEEIAPARAAARIPPGPRVWILAGTADRHARLSEAQAILRALPPGQGRLERFEGAAHSELEAREPARYRRLLQAWLRAPRAPSAPESGPAAPPPPAPPGPGPEGPRSGAR